ncbi:TetR family transcriptional regulator [Streptomyces hygroscopicus subsp. hygroscopicus]|nr:TetR family transcriptional regulator [Streptomyces hygroscopicus subsp. hygroscopicus]
MMTRAAQPSARTFTQDARRAQIVQATIETLAEIGYSKASFSAICRRARLSSTGMISYYFSGKPELFREVGQTILTEAGTAIEASIAAEMTYRGKLGAYIASQVAIVIRRPLYAQALAEIVAMAQARQVDGLDDIARSALSVECLVNLLEQGCRAGEFHTSDSHLMALAIRGAIDNVVRHHHLRDGDVDLERCARQLVDLFDRCVTSA